MKKWHREKLVPFLLNMELAIGVAWVEITDWYYNYINRKVNVDKEQKLGKLRFVYHSTEKTFLSFSAGKYFISCGCFKRMIWIEFSR